MSLHVWNELKQQDILKQTGLKRALKTAEETTQIQRRFCLKLIRNYEFSAFADYLRLRGLLDGISIECEYSDKETFYQDLLAPDAGPAPDAFLVSFWPDLEPSEQSQLNSLNAPYIQVIERLRSQYSDRPIYCAWLPYDPLHTGSAWADQGQAALNMIQEQLKPFGSTVERLPLEALVQQIGLEQSMDLRYQYLFKAPFTNLFLLRLAELIYPRLQAQLGIYRKVLVLDCDNTLWGGIIGEDGLEGIQLDPYEHPGNLYYAFQKQVLALQQRGIQLALCSKNNRADVLEVFEKHPHCLIKSEHLSAYRVNWEPKSSNLSAIAQDLNLGLDSLVFIDDSPHECEEIRQLLPAVEVLAVPERRYELPGLLGRSAIFEGSFDVTNINRNFSVAITQAILKAENSASLDGYLASLDIELLFQTIEPEHIKRAAQLTQKTNQYNLTTYRYTSADIEAFCKSEQAWVYGLWVNDRFGDYGFTGLMILKQHAQQLIIDSFLLSCRVLGRKLQDAFLAATLQDVLAEQPQIETIIGCYRPSPKNQQVADMYPRLGLKPLDAGDSNELRFICDRQELNGLNWELPDYLNTRKRK